MTLHAGYASIAEITIGAPAAIVWSQVVDMGSWIYDFHFEHVAGGTDTDGEVEHLWPIGAEDLKGNLMIAEEDRTNANATVLKTLKAVPGKLLYQINPPKMHDGIKLTGVNVIVLTEMSGKTVVTAIRSKEAVCSTAEECKATQEWLDQNQPVPQMRWTEKYLPRLKALCEEKR